MRRKELLRRGGRRIPCGDGPRPRPPLPPPLQTPSRILLVRLSHLGDVVHALAVLHALQGAYPEAEIAWAVQPEYAELLAPVPGLARVIPFERRGGWRAWPRLRRALRAFAPELAVDAQGNAKSAAVTLASGAPRRVGLAAADWREPLFSLALTERAPRVAASPAARGPHAMERMLALARFVAPGTPWPPRADPVLSAAEREVGRRALEARLPREGGTPVLFHVSSVEDVRAWPLAHWAALARLLAGEGRRVLAVGGPDEEPELARLGATLAGLPRVAVWPGQRGLRALAALYAAAAEAGARLVSADTGPMHLAASVGLPVLALEGPQDAARTGPWPPAPRRPSVPPGAAAPARASHQALRARHEPPCAPCFARACHHAQGVVCMEGLEPARVAAALRAGSA